MILEDDSQNRLYDTCYMTPRTLPVAILLLFFFFTKTCQGCSFQNSPISSTFEDNIESVLKSVLLDYPITIVSNLQPDNWCFDIWYLHFIGKELKRLETVSGENMRNKIGMVRREVTFLEECNFNESSLCLAHQQMNISIFFKTMLHTMNNMKYKIKNNFQNCTWISCVSAPVASVPTEAELYSYEMSTVHPTLFFQFHKHIDQGKQHNKRKRLVQIPILFIPAFIFVILLVALILQPNGHMVRNQTPSSSSTESPDTSLGESDHEGGAEGRNIGTAPGMKVKKKRGRQLRSGRRH